MIANNLLRILAIEDMEADLLLALRAIRKDGWTVSYHRVDRLDDLDAALKEDDWDIVLMDHNVPGLDFLIALRLVQQARETLPVILLTGSIGEERAIEMMQLGVWDLVLKDNMAHIGPSIRRCQREAAERAARLATAAELRLNEARLTLAVDAAAMGIWEWNLGDGATFWSDRCVAITGCSLRKMGFNDFLALLEDREHARVRDVITKAIATRRPFAAEFRLSPSGAEERWIACQGQPRLDAAGDAVQIIGVMQDVTLRHRNETQLRQANAVFAGAQEGVLVTDRGGTILAVNPAFCGLMGYEQAELVGQDARILRSGHHDASFYRDLFGRVAQQGSWQGEIWNRRRDGTVMSLQSTITAVKAANGHISGFVGTYRDDSQIKASESRVEFLAHYDPLTKLPNRTMLLARLHGAITRALVSQGCGAVICLGLDRFKELNDGFGHQIGDHILQKVAQRFRDRLRESDSLARIGGDEFTVLLESLSAPDHAGWVAAELLEAMVKPIELEDGTELFVSVTAGVSIFPNGDNTAEMILRQADSALVQAKRKGGGGFRFANDELLHAAAARVSLDTALRHAVDRHEFILHYQPLVETGSGRPVGVEALVRWVSPEQGLILPGGFIALAEETGLIVRLGAWVLEAACWQFRQWQDEGLALDMLAVNLSPVQFKHPDLYSMIGETLAHSGLPADRLEIEITESALMDGVETESKLRALKQLGVRLSIDDFGTGYSSLAYLKRFPIDKLKIDQSFVREIGTERADLEIVSAVIGLAKNLHLDILAEGVETERQLSLLRSLNCTYAQGYLFSRPIPAAEIPSLIAG